MSIKLQLNLLFQVLRKKLPQVKFISESTSYVVRQRNSSFLNCWRFMTLICLFALLIWWYLSLSPYCDFQYYTCFIFIYGQFFAKSDKHFAYFGRVFTAWGAVETQVEKAKKVNQFLQKDAHMYNGNFAQQRLLGGAGILSYYFRSYMALGTRH